MALNLKNATGITRIPSRVRTSAGTSEERERIYREFFELIDAAKESGMEGYGPATVEGETECNKYQNAYNSFKTDHPEAWAHINTAGNVYEKGSGKAVLLNFFAGANVNAKRLEKAKLARKTKDAGYVQVIVRRAAPEAPTTTEEAAPESDVA